VYEKYIDIGRSLFAEPIITNILEKLLQILRSTDVNAKPFVFVEESSGSGKTQSAFALKRAFSIHSPQRKFFYLVSSEVNDSSQMIYRVFHNISSAFQKCASLDMENMDSENLSCLSLSQSSLYIFGFFFQLLTNSVEDINLEKKTALDVWNIIERKDYPIVILDEFPSLETHSCHYLRLLRNSIRALQFGLVVMGTNSTAANMLDSNHQSREAVAFIWCYLFPRLPRVNMNHLNINPDTPEWIPQVLQTSRPLFSCIASSCLSEFDLSNFTLPDINQRLSDVGKKISEEKRIFDNLYGRHGQVCLFLNMNYSFSSGGSHSSPLIHRHFTRLKDDDVD
jgi:hypothetical protein